MPNIDYPGQARFIGDASEIKIPQCYDCKHWQAERRCAAFDEIPIEILNNFFDHKEPYPGDRGIQFEPIE